MNFPSKRIDEFKILIPRHGKMNTDAIIYASKKLWEKIKNDESVTQIINVASLPGIVGKALAMPDIHAGYGFPIGGVAAFDTENGIISPGGVGYDINCGVRLISTYLKKKDVEEKIEKVLATIFSLVPSGVGSRSRILKLSKREMKEVVKEGARWAVSNGLGETEDLEFIEENGIIKGAEPDAISQRAYERGMGQLGTLGSGNHFIEIDYVEEIYDQEKANIFGIFKNQVVILLHTGSRGFGHQIADDYIKVMRRNQKKYGINLPDQQLACAPFSSVEGQDYWAAMKGAVNYAFANREIITHRIREAFLSVFKKGYRKLGLKLIYDVAHNIAKIEEFEIEKKRKSLIIHRKGATRAYPPHHSLIPQKYRESGQPVLIPGDMGRYSFVLAGTEKAYKETFGSSCHGAGRILSRHQARKAVGQRNIIEEMEKRNITVLAESRRTVVEEVPEAYKDVADVIEVVKGAGISLPVARLKPLGVIKG